MLGPKHTSIYFNGPPCLDVPRWGKLRAEEALASESHGPGFKGGSTVFNVNVNLGT